MPRWGDSSWTVASAATRPQPYLAVEGARASRALVLPEERSEEQKAADRAFRDQINGQIYAHRRARASADAQAGT